MKYWDDIETVRVALRHDRAEAVARELRHDKHGELLLMLSPEERAQLYATGDLACSKTLRWARMLTMANRLDEALRLLEEVDGRSDATAETLDVVARLDAEGRSPGPERVRAVLERAVPRIAERLDLALTVIAVACASGHLDLALKTVRVGVANGLDPSVLLGDPKLASLTADPRFAEAAADPTPPAPAHTEPDLDALAKAWTDVGRAHLSQQNAALVAIYERDEKATTEPDPRSAALADAVIDAVVSLRERPGAARARLDGACGPLAHRHPGGAGLFVGFATILGPDDVLVRAGPSYAPVRMLRLRESRAEPVPGVTAAVANRAHTLLALAKPRAGIEVRASFDGPVLGMFPWPDVAALATDAKKELGPTCIDHLALSGDGTRLLLVGFRQGVFCGSRRPGEPAWRYLGGAGSDMLHGDLSDDGRWVAHGSQGSLHELLTIDDDGTLRPHATVGPSSEYPHCARFTGDGRHVALNACHLYNGATGCFDVEAGAGTVGAHYEGSPHLRAIDDVLRVYAAAWVPGEATAWLGAPDGAFALMGANVLRVVSRTGELLIAQALGQSGSSLDYHPGLGLLAVGTYAGQLHVLDARRGAAVGTEDAWTRGGATAGLHEVRRWLLWRDLPGGPVAW